MSVPIQARRPMLRRRHCLAVFACLGAAVAGCADEPRQEFKPLTFDYLTKLRLTVGAVDIDASWTPGSAPSGQHVEAQSPETPLDALRQMATQRLIPAGNDGHAVFVIDTASIVQTDGRYEGDLKVHLDIRNADGTKSGYAEARVSRTRTVPDQSVDTVRATLFDLVRQMMTDMNVEFEYQVRRSLRDYLQTGAGTAPAPPPVQQQPLTPDSTPVAPAPMQPAAPPVAPDTAPPAPTTLAPPAAPPP